MNDRQKQNLVGKLLYQSDPFKRSGSTKWGRVLDFDAVEAICYNTAAPLGFRIFRVSIASLAEWLQDGTIYPLGRRGKWKRE